MQKIASGNAVNPDTVRLLTASGTLDAINDNIVEMDATAGALSLALPAASTCKGWSFLIKKVDSSANAVTIDPNGTETIDGAATLALSVQWQSVEIESDGVGWLTKAALAQNFNGITQTTVGGAGGATALPATPRGYLQITVAGVVRVIPFFDRV